MTRASIKRTDGRDDEREVQRGVNGPQRVVGAEAPIQADVVGEEALLRVRRIMTKHESQTCNHKYLFNILENIFTWATRPKRGTPSKIEARARVIARCAVCVQRDMVRA